VYIWRGEDEKWFGLWDEVDVEPSGRWFAFGQLNSIHVGHDGIQQSLLSANLQNPQLTLPFE
jgi:hypothetical protein